MPATRSTTLLPGLLDRLADYRRLRQAVTQGKSPLALSGLAAVHRTHFAAALRQDTKRPLVLVCPDDAEARRAAGDLSGRRGPRPHGAGLSLPPRCRQPPVGAAAPGHPDPADPRDLSPAGGHGRGPAPAHPAPGDPDPGLPPAPSGPGLPVGRPDRLPGPGRLHPL